MKLIKSANADRRHGGSWHGGIWHGGSPQRSPDIDWRRSIAILAGGMILWSTIATLGRAQTGEPRNRANSAPLRIGELAPTFQAPAVEGDSILDIKQFRDQKPVILFFGSWT